MSKIGVYSKIFRVDEFVDKAVRSILSQTFADITYYVLAGEKSYNTIFTYAKQDTRIKIIRANDTDDFQEFYKQIAGENDYVFCMDGDDFIEEDCLENLYLLAEQHNLDLAITGTTMFMVHDDGMMSENKSRSLTEDCIITKRTALMQLPFIYQFLRTTWGKLFRSSILLDIDVLLGSLEYGGYGGDTLECFQILSKSDRIGISKGAYYHYRMHTNSASHHWNKGREKSDAFLYYYVENILKENQLLSENNIRFLMAVYFHATEDTLRLVANIDITEQNKCDLYQVVLEHPLTKELKRRCQNNSMTPYCQNTDEVSQSIFHTIFDRLLEKKECNGKEYYRVFAAINDKYEREIEKSLFMLLSKKQRWFELYLSGHHKQLAMLLLEKTINYDDATLCAIQNYILQVFEDGLVLLSVRELKTLRLYPKLVRQIVMQEYHEAKEYCLSILNGLNSLKNKESIIELLINLSALEEDADDFIYGKSLKMNYFISEKQLDNARLEWIDLKEMGVSEEYLSQYKGILYGEEYI